MPLKPLVGALLSYISSLELHFTLGLAALPFHSAALPLSFFLRLSPSLSFSPAWSLSLSRAVLLLFCSAASEMVSRQSPLLTSLPSFQLLQMFGNGITQRASSSLSLWRVFLRILHIWNSNSSRCSLLYYLFVSSRWPTSFFSCVVLWMKCFCCRTTHSKLAVIRLTH